MRKIGHPANPEFALGAIAEGGGTQLDEDLMANEGLEFTDIEPIIEDAMQQMRRRQGIFAPSEPVSLAGKIVLLTDEDVLLLLERKGKGGKRTTEKSSK